MARSDHDRRIAEMFDRVAPRYDALNRILSGGRDVGWRRRAIALARLGPREVALDVGVGTGDLSFGLLAVSDPSARIIAMDLSPVMLDMLRRRADVREARRVAPLLANAERLPFADGSFDRVVAGFAVRNFGDLTLGLREVRRVLRSGGRAVVLELSTPPNPLVGALYRLYFEQLSPRIAALLGGDAAAYHYLPRSVAAFPGADALAERMRDAGFARVRYERLSFGIAAIHVGEA
ncbi:MAG TPA: ubiquinone/menaquinone biosynthesis methyltransferase [Candidatus Limnocylindria bacterium]|jgi:demethylmenaquinone methyltransferase/2-methoxy-6-polyprenyl-1,4-benzoquinol methylase|nr:ubiquinone/menaquinone biosynthesis methyltransferase [Candidatus Limnocylindria bacterium]